MVHWEWSLGGTNGVVRGVDELAMQTIQLHDSSETKKAVTDHN